MFHHHHYGYGGYGYGGYRVRSNCSICAIPIFIILLIIVVIIVLISNPSVKINTDMGKCEQIISCPSSLRDNTIEFKTTGSDVTAYIVKSRPSLFPDYYESNLTETGRYLSSNEYLMHSFNLIKGSVLTWDIPASNSFQFYLLRGESEYNNFKDDESFNWVKKSFSSEARDSYTAPADDEYFAIADAYTSTSVRDYTFNVQHKRFNINSYEDKSTDSKVFKVKDSFVPNGCIILDMPCEVSSTAAEEISLNYEVAYGTVFYVCIALIALFGVGVVASIIFCIMCVVKQKKGTEGTTYQQVPPSTAQAPAYPAGYQQPQPVATYQQPPPAGYDPNAPAAYDPNAPVYANAGGAPPAFNPGYDPSYGAIQTSY